MAQHLTLAEREFLQRLVKAKKTKAEIGALMNRHRSTIYRDQRGTRIRGDITRRLRTAGLGVAARRVGGRTS